MKTFIPFIVLGLCSLILAPQLRAQGTAFTYQGRLNDGAGPASGSYDLQFTIYDSTNVPGNIVAGPITNAATATVNGLFTVSLDFGVNVFLGGPRWLAIAVRTNAAGAFTTLAPRQPISAAPYAMTARDVTGNVAANQLTGTIQPANIGAGTITSTMMASDSIHSNHLAVGSVHSNALVIGSIHSNHLAVGSIHSNHLSAGSIHSNALAIGSVTATALANNSIHSNHLAVGSVHSNALAAGSVHSNALVIGSIHSNHIAAGSVHSNALALGSVTAVALVSGSIHSNHLAVGSVHSNALVIGSIHSNHLSAGSIHSNALAIGSVTASALAAGSIHSNHLAAGSVHSNALVIGSIHSNHIAAGSIHSNALALGSVTAAALAAGSIHSNALALGSVTAVALASDSIHSNHLAVGSVDSSALAAGAVSLDKLITATTVAVLPTTITDPTPGFFEYFGASVAAVGTDKLLIGAHQDSTAADNAGAAFLLTTNGTLQTTFLKPGAANQDSFGYAVAAAGLDKVLIGAHGDNTDAFDSGAAYLFSTNGTLITAFTNPTPAVQDFFGYAVATVGTDKVLIGALGDHFGANLGGAAYLFTTNRILLTTFTNPTPAASDRFGIAVAAVGADKILIGADLDDRGATDAGVAYLFHINGTLLTTFTNPTPANGDFFGSAVTTVGLDKVLIGASADNSGGNVGGAAYLFDTSGTLLTTFTNPSPASGDEFGVAVAAVGVDKVLIGASSDSTGAPAAGAAYLFNTSGALLNTFNNPSPGGVDHFGIAVAALSTDTFLIGASSDDVGATDAGAAYLFTLSTYVPGLVPDPSIGGWLRSGPNISYSGGNVGIGTTSPQATLQVSGNNSHLRLHDTGRGNFWDIYTENHPNQAISGNLLFFPGPGGVFGFIQKSTGNYFSGSDARLKTDIRGLRGVLDRVLQLRPVSYRFKSAAASARPTIGLIAQEVEPLFPEVVAEHDGLKSLAYSELVPVTVGAIQELNRKVDAGTQKAEVRVQKLEAENAELKARLEKLERLIQDSL